MRISKTLLTVLGCFDPLDHWLFIKRTMIWDRSENLIEVFLEIWKNFFNIFV